MKLEFADRKARGPSPVSRIVPSTQTFMVKLCDPSVDFSLDRFSLAADERWHARANERFGNALSFWAPLPGNNGDEKRRLSLKVFCNGVMQITGCKAVEDMTEVVAQFVHLLRTAHCFGEDAVVYAYSSMLNQNIHLRQKVDHARLEAFLIEMRALHPDAFLLDSREHKKKIKGRCIMIKKAIPDRAAAPVRAFVWRDGGVREEDPITLRAFYARHPPATKARLKMASVYFNPDRRTVFFSMTDEGAARHFLDFLQDLLVNLELWTPRPQR